MAFKITAANQKEIDAYLDKLNEQRKAIEAELDAFNDALSAIRGRLEEAVAAYNETVADVRTTFDDIVSEKRSEWEDKSEKWQESYKGQAADLWLSELESFADNIDEATLDDIPEVVDVESVLPNDPYEDYHTTVEREPTE